MAISHEPDIARSLIRAGADLDLQDNFGRTALMLASLYNYDEAAVALIAAGASLNLKDTDGCTALMLACGNFSDVMISGLIQAGAILDIQGSCISGSADKVNGCTALMIACLNDDTSICAQLIEAGASVNLQDEFGWTSLMAASRAGNGAIVKVLIRAGADMFLTNVLGGNAMDVAQCSFLSGGMDSHYGWRGHAHPAVSRENPYVKIPAEECMHAVTRHLTEAGCNRALTCHAHGEHPTRHNPRCYLRCAI